MGSKWPGYEQRTIFTIPVSAAATPVEPSKHNRATLEFSLWPNHARPIGMLYHTESIEDSRRVRESWYLMPDEAEALGTALIYYAKQLKGEL